jgi:hypothetical protein
MIPGTRDSNTPNPSQVFAADVPVVHFEKFLQRHDLQLGGSTTANSARFRRMRATEIPKRTVQRSP